MKILAKISSFWHKNYKRRYKVLYFTSFLIFAVYHLIQGIEVKNNYSSGKYVEQNVYIHRFEMVDCKIVDDLTFFGTSDNSRLIYNGNIESLYMDCQYSYGLKEWKAYYNTTGDYSFSEENALSPICFENYLMYDFPEDTVQVKMPYANSKMYFNELVINCRDHTNDYNITGTSLVTLAIMPTIVFLAIDFVMTLLSKISKTSKKSSP